MQSTVVPTGRPVTMAPRGMVAAPHFLAAEAGVWALQQGGNAVDAAVTANAVLGVVYPHMAGLGGDAFFVVWHPEARQPICLNGSGHSGYQATPQYYRDRGHEAVPNRGPLAACTVPAAVAAWGDVHSRWGALPWDQLLEPAIHYADRGFPVTASLASSLARHESLLERYEATRAVFTRDGRPYVEGDLLVQRDLAQTLRTLADDGPEAFYLGDLAEEIIAYLEEHGSLLTRQDLEDQHSDWTTPLSVTYRGLTLYQPPPNSEGLEALFMLRLLDGLDLQAIGDGTAHYYHTLIEAGKVTLADLSGRMADPNYARLPLDQLLAEYYVDRRRALIQADRARLPAEYAAGLLFPLELSLRPSPAGAATGYIAAVDDRGLTVSLIQSLHSEFGSGVVAGRTGVLLHNAGASFTLDGQAPNRLEARKRPAEPLMPGLLSAGERPLLALGASGGQSEAPTLAALITRIVDFGHNIQQAIEAPRWLMTSRQNGDLSSVTIEGRVPDSAIRRLRELGHDVKVGGDWSEAVGRAQGIAIDWARGGFHGGADPRGDGAAAGW